MEKQFTTAATLFDVASEASDWSAWVSPEAQRDALAQALKLCLPLLPEAAARDARDVLRAVFPFEEDQ